MEKPKKLPEQVYIYWEGEPPEQYLGVLETPRGIDDGVQVGVYQLIAVKHQKITEELV